MELNKVLSVSIIFIVITIVLFSGCIEAFRAAKVGSMAVRVLGSDNNQSSNTVTSSSERNTQTDSKYDTRAAAISKAMDYTNPITRDFAVSIIPQLHGGDYNTAQICDLWETVYKKWTYVNDPNGEDYVSPASRTIQIGLKGDCDDFAVTIGSIILAIGGSSRIVSAYNQEGGHAYAEVLVCKSEKCIKNIASYIGKRYGAKHISYHTETNDGVTNYWLNLDWQSRFPGGDYFHDSGEIIIYYPNGYWEKANT